MSTAADPKAFVSAFNAGRPGVATSINQAGLPESFERFLRENGKINTGDVTHQVIIGKRSDGMSGFAQCLPSDSDASLATGLLAGLLRRI